jgi:signal transduction histidine kinase
MQGSFERGCGLAQLDAVAAALGELAVPAVVEGAVAEVRARFDDDASVVLGAVALTARVLVTVAWETPERLEATDDAIAAVAETLGLAPGDVAAAVAEVAFVESCTRLLPPLMATRCALDLLCALARLRGASLWTRNEAGSVVAVCGVGSGSQSGRAGSRAAALIAGEVAEDDGAIAVVPVVRHGERVGAITLRANRSSHRAAAQLAASCAASVAAAVDRSMLLERRAAAERMLVEAGEHRLRRVGLDLHDGPLQTAAQLAGELKLLRDQAGELSIRDADLDKLCGRLDDLLGRLSLLDDELRELAAGFESPVVLNASFETALADEVAAFERRSSQRAEFRLSGSLDALSPSQRIALYRMLQEALANVRQHSGATTVDVSVVAEPTGVRAEIRDDGVGFDPQIALGQFKGRRHLGLAGIRERALLLGGAATIDSRPGGPTRLSIFLPASTTLPDLVGDLVWALGSPRHGQAPGVTRDR